MEPPGSQCCVKTIRELPGAQLASVALWSVKCVICLAPVPSGLMVKSCVFDPTWAW